MAGETLTYQSPVPGALQDGETILWERTTQPPSSRRTAWGSVLLGVGLLMIVVSAATREPDLVLGVVLVIGGALAAIGVLLLKDGISATASGLRPICRVTDRRLMCIDRRRGGSELSLGDLRELVVTGRDDAAASLAFVSAMGIDDQPVFDNVPDAQRVIGLVLSSEQLRERRWRLRRTQQGRMNHLNTPSDGGGMNEQAVELPPGVYLQPEEVVLWVGRPRPWARKNLAWLRQKSLACAWGIIPATILAAAWGALGPRFANVNLVLQIGAGIWLILLFVAQVVTPIIQAARNRRSSYVLTNQRAIFHYNGRGKRITRSYLLDMAAAAELAEEVDGSGTIMVGDGMIFVRVVNARDVHAKVLAAIAGAGVARAAPPMHGPSDALM